LSLLAASLTTLASNSKRVLLRLLLSVPRQRHNHSVTTALTILKCHSDKKMPQVSVCGI
jgi:hypothetical protein